MLAAFCVLLAVRICYQRRYIRTSDRINDCIFRNVAAYLLLIDPDFNVLQTNYRSATGTAPKAVPPKVGNLLRCRNGEDAGVCGTHELCADARRHIGIYPTLCPRKASRDWRSRWCSTPPTTARQPSTAT